MSIHARCMQTKNKKLSIFTQALHRISSIIFSVYTPNFHPQFHPQLNQHPPSMFYMAWIFILLCPHLCSRFQGIAVVYISVCQFVSLSFRDNDRKKIPPKQNNFILSILYFVSSITSVYGKTLECGCNWAYVDSGSLTALLFNLCVWAWNDIRVAIQKDIGIPIVNFCCLG